ncbi:hypothetical protein FRC17_001060 [Serendipita sp. 399]|nr:hypothetical protein FRC17_001060 [Serendipita sp. 399]
MGTTSSIFQAKQATQNYESIVFRLPVEILEEIFRRVAWQSSSIRNVRLTCRDFRDLVDADRTLPRHISLQMGGHCRHFHYPAKDQRDHCVHNAKQLVAALECIKGAPFHFRIIMHWMFAISLDHPLDNKILWDSVPWHIFSAQCTGVAIGPISGYNRMTREILQYIPPLPNLKYFDSRGNSLVSPSLIAQLIPVDTPSPQSLELSWAPEFSSQFDEAPSDSIFQNIKTFNFSHVEVLPNHFLIALFSSFRALKYLTWNEYMGYRWDPDTIRRGIDWNFRLQRLRTKSSLLLAIPPTVLTDLLVLTVDLDTSEDTPLPEVENYRLHLPHLTELTLNGLWVSLVQVEAPNLRHLNLVGHRGDSGYLARTKLTPSFLNISDEGSGQTMEALLEREPWPRVTELLLHVEAHWACRDGRLAKLFSVDTVTAKFPQMKTLLIEIRRRWTRNTGELRMMTQEQVEEDIFSSFGARPYSISVL